jgi:hypothetical protein
MPIDPNVVDIRWCCGLLPCLYDAVVRHDQEDTTIEELFKHGAECRVAACMDEDQVASTLCKAPSLCWRHTDAQTAATSTNSGQRVRLRQA